MYQRYTKLIESTFINIMKEFVNQENIKNMYDIIFLLLLGNDDSIDIAGLLIGLIKEKKNNKNQQTTTNLFDYMYDNMTYYIQSKIKKSNINIKNSIEKLKSINIDEVDYKKQLIINKNIPENVKVMVLEKIDEIDANRKNSKERLDKIFTNNIPGLRAIHPLDKASTNWFGTPFICDEPGLKHKLVQHLEENLIQTRNYFAGNILMHPGYKHLGDYKEFPEANKVLDKVFFIGAAPHYTEEVFAYVEEVVKKFNK
jgi:hypothetical protein